MKNCRGRWAVHVYLSRMRNRRGHWLLDADGYIEITVLTRMLDVTTYVVRSMVTDTACAECRKGLVKWCYCEQHANTHTTTAVTTKLVSRKMKNRHGHWTLDVLADSGDGYA